MNNPKVYCEQCGEIKELIDIVRTGVIKEKEGICDQDHLVKFRVN